MVAYPIIIAEMMEPAKPGLAFDASKEAARFSWLVQTATRDELEVGHGACPVSREMLNLICTITYLAKYMQFEEDRGNADPLDSKLLQYADAIRDQVDNRTDYSFRGHQPSHWDTMTDPAEMRAETARAWAILTVVYMLARVYNHRQKSEVIGRYWDMMRLILTRLPEDGELLTAEAPFFPIFMLTVLGGNDNMSREAMEWLKKVSNRKIRSVSYLELASRL